MRIYRRYWIPTFVALLGLGGVATIHCLSQQSGHPIANGTQRMVARLASIARFARPESGENNQEAIEQIQLALTQPLPPNQQSLLRQALAYQFRLVGRNVEAIEEYRTAIKLLEGLTGSGPREAIDKLHTELGISYLRIA